MEGSGSGSGLKKQNKIPDSHFTIHHAYDNFKTREVDLGDSKYSGDGTSQRPQKSGQTIESDVIFLRHLNREFNRSEHVPNLGYRVNFISNPPQGYTLYFRPDARHPRGGHHLINGHPAGEFYSWTSFCQHVASIIQHAVSACKCLLCRSPGSPSDLGWGEGGVDDDEGEDLSPPAPPLALPSSPVWRGSASRRIARRATYEDLERDVMESLD